MLSLKSSTPAAWFKQVDANLEEILIDHAHCEKKAAGTAMNLLFAYVDHVELCREMAEIVNEELDHFQQVLSILQSRGIRFRRLRPAPYGQKLHEQVRKQEPGRAIDRLLVAGLIEARSCERFDLLRKHLSDRDQELASFYDGLFESEAKHHATYVRLAKDFADEGQVHARLHELSEVESRIVCLGDVLPRMHS